MKTIEPRVIGVAVLLVLTLVSGVWVSRSGAPYDGLKFNVHKLIAVGAIVLFGLAIRQLRAGGAASGLALPIVVLTGVLFLALIATGGMLSIGKPDVPAVLSVHRIAPLLAVGSSAASLLLMGSPFK